MELEKNTQPAGARADVPEISVIVPVYNVAPYLAACLDSLLAQTFSAFELILVEDGSTDGSRAIAEDYAMRDARIHLVTHRWNHGVTAAHNLGLELSRGRYVAFVDSDDVAAPDCFTVLHHFAEVQQADIVQAGYQEFSECVGDGTPYRLTQVPKRLSTRLVDRVHCFWPVRIHIAPWGKLYRRAFLDEHRMVFYDMPVADDVCFHYQGLLTAAQYIILPDILYHYRVRATSIANVKGAQRKERYAVAMARAMAEFTTWMQGESLFSDRAIQRELRDVLCSFFLQELMKGETAETVEACCLRALEDEPHEKLFEALLRRALQESRHRTEHQ